MYRVSVNVHYDVVVPVTVDMEVYNAGAAITQAELIADETPIEIKGVDFDVFEGESCVTEVRHI